MFVERWLIQFGIAHIPELVQQSLQLLGQLKYARCELREFLCDLLDEHTGEIEWANIVCGRVDFFKFES